jgi:hypothetical protein
MKQHVEELILFKISDCRGRWCKPSLVHHYGSSNNTNIFQKSDSKTIKDINDKRYKR